MLGNSLVAVLLRKALVWDIWLFLLPIGPIAAGARINMDVSSRSVGTMFDELAGWIRVCRSWGSSGTWVGFRQGWVHGPASFRIAWE